MKYLYSLLGFVLLISCNNTKVNPYKPDPFIGLSKTTEDFNLKGIIKEVQEASYPILTSADEKIDWENALAIGNSNFLRFDKEGRMVEKFSGDDKSYIQYNKEGKLTKAQIAYRDKESNKIKIIDCDFKYDSNKRLTKIHRDDEYTHSASYDDNGNCTSVDTYGDGKSKYLKYDYDKENRVTRHANKSYVYKGNTVIDTVYYTDGKPYELNIQKYKGDKITLYEVYDIYLTKQKRIKTKISYQYNHYNDLIDRLESEGKFETRKNHYVVEYEYDTEGNWIKKIEYLNGELEGATIRKIEYYQKKYFGILK